jgi:hypothetical protein
MCVRTKINPANFTLELLYPRHPPPPKLIIHYLLCLPSRNNLTIWHNSLRLNEYSLMYLKPHTLNTSSHLYPMNWMHSLRQSSLIHIITWLLFHNCWRDISFTALLHYCTWPHPSQRNIQTYIMNNILKYYFSHKSITFPLPSLSCISLSLWECFTSIILFMYNALIARTWKGGYERSGISVNTLDIIYVSPTRSLKLFSG